MSTHFVLQFISLLFFEVVESLWFMLDISFQGDFIYSGEEVGLVYVGVDVGVVLIVLKIFIANFSFFVVE